MRVCVQHTKRTPTGYVDEQSDSFGSVAVKPEPTGGETLDELDGWVYAECCQGVTVKGHDHYAVEHVDAETCRITGWSDDPFDWPVGTRHAEVWTFRNLAPDDALGGAINTSQTKEIYAEDDSAFISATKPWRDFVAPTRNVRHGIWVSDDEAAAHDAAGVAPSWRTWTEGLDPSELDDSGRLKSQRTQGRYKVPDGTLTFFMNDNSTVDGPHTVLSGNERELNQTIGSPVTLFGGNLGVNDSALYAAQTTLANEPNNDDWPDGNYRAQYDIAAAGSGLTYGLRTAGAVTGHFARLNSTITTDLETHEQVEALASGTGIKLFTTGAVSWTAGALGDRFEVLLACARDGVGHGQQSMDYELGDVDSFADGPWDGVQELAGTVDGVGALSGALDVDKALDATVAGLGALTAALDVAKTLGATVAGQSALSADLQSMQALESTVAGQSALTVALEIATALDATVTGVSALSAALVVDHELDGTVAGQSALTVALEVLKTLSATVVGQSALTADLQNIKTLTATVAGQSAVTAAIDRARGLTASVDALSALTAALRVDFQIDATVAGQSALSAALSVQKELSATIDGTSALTADLQNAKALEATVAAQSALSADLAVTLGFAGSIDGVSALTAALEIAKVLSAAVDGQSALTSALDIARALDATVAGTSALSAAVVAQRGLSASVAGQSAVSGTLAIARQLSAAVAGLSALTGNLNVAKRLTATVAGISSLAADLEIDTGFIELSGTIAAVSMLSAELNLAPSEAAHNTIVDVLVHRTIAELLVRRTIAEVKR